MNLSISDNFSSEKYGTCWESNLGQLCLEARMLTTVLCCHPPVRCFLPQILQSWMVRLSAINCPASQMLSQFVFLSTLSLTLALNLSASFTNTPIHTHILPLFFYLTHPPLHTLLITHTLAPTHTATHSRIQTFNSTPTIALIHSQSLTCYHSYTHTSTLSLFPFVFLSLTQ